MPRRLSPILVPILFALALASCGNMPRGGGPGVPTPVCLPENLQIPVLFTPADGTNIEIPGLTFQWVYNPAGCVPSTFEIQVSQSASFDNYSGTTLAADQSHWSPEVGLLSATVYYWRMRAAVPDGQGPWSPIWSFYTGPVCELASLVSPETFFPRGYMFVYDAPFFQWTYPDETCVAEGYHLQIASSPDFSTLIFDQSRVSPSTLWSPTVDFENCSVFYWRVAGIQGTSDGPYSATQSFSVNVAGGCTQPCTPEQLVAPVPISPAHYSNVGTAPTEGLVPGLLQWGYPMPCFPEGFAIHLSTERDWSDTSLFGGASPVTMAGGNWSPAVPLEPATQYWWEVAAGVGTTFGPYSPARSFFTGPDCASADEVVVPALLSPDDGETVNTLSPWLRYTPGEGGCIPDGYAVYLDTDPDFVGEDPYSSINFPGTTFIPDPLDDCTTYYWRVSPLQDEFVMPWSEVRSFATRTSVQCGLSVLEGLALETLACRYGPGPGWEIRGYFAQGERSPIYARNMSGEWLAIQNPDNIAEMCWVPREGVEPLGDDGNLRIFNPPATEVSCSVTLPQDQCLAAGGTWASGPAVGAPSYYCQCP